MKTLKLAFIAASVLLGVGGAFATAKPYQTVYYKTTGGNFVPVPGPKGGSPHGYFCNLPSATCTYIQNGQGQFVKNTADNGSITVY